MKTSRGGSRRSGIRSRREGRSDSRVLQVAEILVSRTQTKRMEKPLLLRTGRAVTRMSGKDRVCRLVSLFRSADRPGDKMRDLEIAHIVGGQSRYQAPLEATVRVLPVRAETRRFLQTSTPPLRLHLPLPMTRGPLVEGVLVLYLRLGRRISGYLQRLLETISRRPLAPMLMLPHLPHRRLVLMVAKAPLTTTVGRRRGLPVFGRQTDPLPSPTSTLLFFLAIALGRLWTTVPLLAKARNLSALNVPGSPRSLSRLRSMTSTPVALIRACRCLPLALDPSPPRIPRKTSKPSRKLARSIRAIAWVGSTIVKVSRYVPHGAATLPTKAPQRTCASAPRIPRPPDRSHHREGPFPGMQMFGRGSPVHLLMVHSDPNLPPQYLPPRLVDLSHVHLRQTMIFGDIPPLARGTGPKALRTSFPSLVTISHPVPALAIGTPAVLRGVSVAGATHKDLDLCARVLLDKSSGDRLAYLSAPLQPSRSNPLHLAAIRRKTTELTSMTCGTCASAPNFAIGIS